VVNVVHHYIVVQLVRSSPLTPKHNISEALLFMLNYKLLNIIWTQHRISRCIKQSQVYTTHISSRIVMVLFMVSTCCDLRCNSKASEILVTIPITSNMGRNTVLQHGLFSYIYNTLLYRDLPVKYSLLSTRDGSFSIGVRE
jgi:hypothetical protein